MIIENWALWLVGAPLHPAIITVRWLHHWWLAVFKMTARFVDVLKSEIDQVKENAAPQKTKDAKKFGVKLLKGRFSFASNAIYRKLVCLFTFFCFKVSATFSNFCEIFCSTEWFQQQQEFTNEIENMEVDELNKFLTKFYVSVRKTDGSNYKKTNLLLVRAALDRHLNAPKSFKNMSLFLFYFLE